MLRPPRLAPRRRAPAKALALLPCVARLAKMPTAADVWEAHSRRPLPIIQAARKREATEEVVNDVADGVNVVPDSVPGASKANFSRIYAREEWDGQALSGLGSREETTREFRRFMEDFLQERGISSVVDAGCGHWPSGYQRFMQWHGVGYTGVDVVPYVVEENARYFQDTATLESHCLSSARFMCGDVSESLPSADLLLVKDVLMHLPNRAVHEFLKNSTSDLNSLELLSLWKSIATKWLGPGVGSSKYRYVMLVQNAVPPVAIRDMVDIQPGQLLPFDITLSPFKAWVGKEY